MITHYKLEGKRPVPCGLMEWAEYFEKADRHVALTKFKNGDSVSTVFLGLDHNWSGKGRPILFETMIFGGEHNEYQERYCTWEEAEEGHKRALKLYFEVPEVPKGFHNK